MVLVMLMKMLSGLMRNMSRKLMMLVIIEVWVDVLLNCVVIILLV